MKQLVLELPDDLNIDEKDALLFFAAKMFEAGRLTLSQAAQSVGMNSRQFSDILSDYSVSLINYTSEELSSDADKF